MGDMNDVMAKSITVEQLRELIRREISRGVTQGEIADKAGMRGPHLSRFLNEPDLGTTVETAERLAAAVGFRLTLTPIFEESEKVSG